MNHLTIIFFGSTSDSVIVLEKLYHFQTPASPAGGSNFKLQIISVVTQPPKPVGRDQLLTPTPVQIWAMEHNVTFLSFPTGAVKPWLFLHEENVIDSLSPLKADLIVTASYGQLIPYAVIEKAQYGGLNVHPSLLPRWRGADPVPWSILAGDNQTGVTVLTLSKEFDEGKIIAQKKVPLTSTEIHEELRKKLFEIGAELLCSHIENYVDGKDKGVSQNPAKSTYARRLTRDDGYIPWELLQKAFNGEDVDIDTLPKLFQEVAKSSFSRGHVAYSIEHASRALTPWPGLWTKVGISNKESGIMEEKRLKILSCHMTLDTLTLDTIQLEGKKPVSWSQFKSAYLTKLPS